MIGDDATGVSPIRLAASSPLLSCWVVVYRELEIVCSKFGSSYGILRSLDSLHKRTTKPNLSPAPPMSMTACNIRQWTSLMNFMLNFVLGNPASGSIILEDLSQRKADERSSMRSSRTLYEILLCSNCMALLIEDHIVSPGDC